MSYLDELNEVQHQAVTNIDGPQMIIAGPGSGKTRVLTYRIAYLMEQGIDPFRILALTFTNKAAKEMQERIKHILGGEARNLFMGTFHSIFARILRMEANKLGYPNNFTIYDTADAKSLLKTIIKEEGLNDKMYKAATVFYRISNCKNNLIGPNDYDNYDDLIEEDEQSGRPKFGELYKKYCVRCFKAGAMDFDDLLLKMHELLSNFPDVLLKYQKRFTHIMIDEFQDTNTVQYAIVKMLADRNQNICVVGDDAQSIYAFRGATIQNILNYEKDYPDLKIYKLEQNYRSTPFIVEAANDIIKNNKDQLEKKIWTNKTDGDKINVYKTQSDTEEARLVADTIFEHKMRHHISNDEIAILYRTNAQSRSFEESLRKLNIPYKIYGGTSFYQRKEIKDFLAYLRVTVNPNDEEALKRVINYPVRGIGQTSIERLIIAADEHDLPLWHMVQHAETIQGLTARAINAIKNFALMIKSFQVMLRTKNAYEIAEYIGKTSKLVLELFNDKTVEGISRYENVQELLNGIKEYTVEEKPEYEEEEVKPENDLAAYLQQISLLTDQDEDDKDMRPKVKLMTIHAAKGLEFESVFIVGLEENLFPSALSIFSREDIEEERRLFYVAVTRAKQYLTLSYALMRYKFGQLNYNDPSRFIEEINDKHLKFLGQKKKENTQNTIADETSNSKWYLSKAKETTAKPITTTEISKNLTSKSKAVKKAKIDVALNDLAIGTKVYHEKFDTGKVIAIEGVGDNKIATIYFDTSGNKKIMLKFAKLEVIE
ncbi:MAG: UvrD-helicase domain-containing protein [Chitinophagales bacterium]|nr:UvrD-helicase domain-containing protein [Chitinophagales bacterium]